SNQRRDSISKSRDDRQKATFIQSLSAKRALSIAVFNNARGKLLRKIFKSRHPIIYQVRIQQLSVLIDHLFQHRVADAEHDRAFVLTMHLGGINGFADVGDRDIIQQLDDTRLRVDFNFHSTPSDFPKSRRRSEHGFLASLVAIESFADNFSGLAAEEFHNDFAVHRGYTASGVNGAILKA